jgi:large repetitive protein
VRGDYLLTAAYDSDKDTKERLFRDIQPDEFYPVYGDAAIRGFDAQSTSRLYVRVDKNKSYLLYGDFTTQGDNVNVRRLSAYSRSLTGAKHHFDNGRVETNVFASRDTTRQVIDELRANGTSGPYELTSAAGRINSEKVEILVRDRNRPALVLSSTGQARFYDYEIEPLTGRILFKAPVPSVDQDLNPVSIRITYEVDQGGDAFWVFGGDAQVKVTDNITVGASFAEDRNPADPFKLAGAYAVVRIGAVTTVSAEYARTDRAATVGQGDAARLHVRHDGEKLKAEAFVARTDASFDNPGAYLGQGRGESGARASYKIDDKTQVKAEALRTEDVKTGNVRDGYMASVERTFDNKMKVEVGVRHAREEGGPAIAPSLASGGSVAPNEVTSVRARVTTPVPGMDNASVYGEVEVDVQDAERKIVAIGGDYALPNKGKIYLRHELISSLTGPYGLNEQQRQNTTVLGIDTEYMKDGRVFSEYRIRDAISGGDAEAAIGLRNLWTLATGLRLGTTLERVHSLSGTGQNENTAVALALEYVANPMWKGSTRLELRDGQSGQSLLHTVGFAARVAKEWTFLGRNTLSIQRAKGGERDGGERTLERLQAGLAYRDADTDRVNALARVEHREERDDTQAGVDLKRSTELVSIHADYKLNRPFTLTGRYAAKWTSERSNGISSKYRAQLASGRLTWEFAPKWDIGLAASGLFGEGGKGRQFGVGLEVGYLVATNLWVSAGYNVLGYKDDDLAAGEYTQKGAYVRLRYKFDEALFGGAEAAK